MENPQTTFTYNAYNTQPNLTFSQLQNLLDSLQDVVCAIDIDGNFAMVSKAALQVWGYHPEELIGKPYIDFVVEEDREKTAYASDRLIAGIRSENFENRYYRKDGSVVTVSWSGRWDARDKMIYCIGRDASHKKQMESLTAKHEEDVKKFHLRLFAILEHIQDGFLACDLDATITYWNAKAEALTGKSRTEVIGKSLWECFPDAVDEQHYQQYQKMLSKRQPVQYEAFIERENRWLEINAYMSDDGSTAFFRDITERKKVEEELVKLSLVAKETDNAVLLTDADGVITWVNNAFTAITGYSFEEAVGHKPGCLLRGAETDEKMVQFIDEQTRKGETYHVEILNYKKNKEAYWSDLYCQPIFDEKGKLQRYIYIETDITERKKLQDRLKFEIEERQKKITAAVLQAQEQERAEIGKELHDNINQMLTSVKLYNEMCLRGALDENVRDMLSKSVQYLNNAINEIRSLSKQLSAPTIGDIHIKDSIKELVDSITLLNDIEVTLDAPALAELNLDQELHVATYRILQEHLTNVLKHGKAEHIFITIKSTSKSLSILVVDDGVGFNVHERRRGIGINNMITRAESLNGSLKIISSPGNGCTLFASFPLI